MTTEAPGPGGRRQAVARGVVINAGFQIGLGALNLLKAVIAAAFLTQGEFGVWSILFLGIALVIGLKAVAVGDKYIQQDEDDQELAFQKGFTLELISSGLMIVLALLIAPLLVLIYDEPELLVPAMVLALMLPGLALQAPIWVFYRRMDFMRQRLFMSVDPVISFVITVALAVAGLGYWSLVIGSVAGALAGGLVAIVGSPYKLALRYDHGTMRTYVSFSLPLVVAIGSGLLIAQFSVIFGKEALGLAGAGAIGLAAIFSAWTDRADAVITQAMYPAICRVTEQKELLLEAFIKSNRLALMWAVPFGAGLALFADDLIHYILGEQWADALILFQVFGVIAAINHIGFNWGAFYRAIGDTKPIAVVTVAALLTFLAVPSPLLFSDGLPGFAWGMVVMAVVSMLARGFYVNRLFPRFPVWRHVLRAVAPVIPAIASVLALRLLADGERTAVIVVGELVLYVGLTVAMTLVFERRLLREATSYLGPVRPVQAGAP